MKRSMLFLLVFLLAATAWPVLAGEAPVTREGFVTMLWQSAGAVPYETNAPFSDVPADAEGATAIAWAYSWGLVYGAGAGCFLPERSLTREEAAAILRRYASALGRDTSIPEGLSACNDREGISPWADDALYWATSSGLLMWSEGGLLDPAGPLTPTQAEGVIRRFVAGM